MRRVRHEGHEGREEEIHSRFVFVSFVSFVANLLSSALCIGDWLGFEITLRCRFGW